jgi:hypothetical protein
MSGLVDIDKIIIGYLELDELRELVCVNKYFNSLVNEQFPRLRKTLIILDEFQKFVNIVQIGGFGGYTGLKYIQVQRKLSNYIFKLLRKNEILIAKKIICYMDKYNWVLDLPGQVYYYAIFQKVVEKHYTNEYRLLTNLIKIHPPNVNWLQIIERFEYWLEELQVDTIIITLLDLLRAAVSVNNEDFIVILIKSYYEHDLANWEEEEIKDIIEELSTLIKSLEESSQKYANISKEYYKLVVKNLLY